MSENERGPFEALLDMCERLGVQAINELPSCWEYQISEGWWVAVNGHKEPMPSQSPQHSTPSDVPPFTAYIEWHGWPAGLLDPAGGVLAAGELANERTFIAACDAVNPSAEGRAAAVQR